MVLLDLEMSNKLAGQVEKFRTNRKRQESEDAAMAETIKKDLEMKAGGAGGKKKTT